jgi:hypothetical protein
MNDKVKTVTGVGALNFDVPKESILSTADLPPEEQQDIMDARNKALDTLEARYAQPNWFKVSAGFLEPKLGGFGASLGSAFNAMGENVEQQRALAPTIAVERAKLAQMESLMKKNERGANMVAEVLGLGPDAGRKLTSTKNLKTVITPENVNQISGAIGRLRAAGQNDYADSLKAALDAFNLGTTTRGTETQTQIAAQEAAAKLPTLVLKDPAFSGTAVNQSSEQMQQSLAKLDAARPKDVDADKWNAMGTSAKLALLGNYNSELATKGMDEEQKSAFTARSSDNLLNDLTYLRTLAIEPKLSPLFSLYKNGDAISMFRSFLDQNQGNVSRAVEGMVAAAADSLKNADYETRQKADKLIKGIARLEVNLRGSNVNPTDALQTLNSLQSPNLANSQAGFVGILDQMGLQAKHEIDRHSLRVDSNIPARKILSSNESRAMENRYRDEADQLARSNALNVMPSWYRPTNTQTPQSAPTATTMPPANPPAATTTAPASARPATGGGSTLDRARAIQAERQRNRQP